MTAQDKSSLSRHSVFAVVLFVCTFSAAFGQEAARPDRGTTPNRTYSVSDIENISLQNGNVNLSIPLAALPPIAGGKLSWAVNAKYNSKLWNVTRSQQDDPNDLEWHPYVVDTPQLSDLGGWTGGGYYIQFRNSNEDFDRQWYPGNSGLPYQELVWLNDYQWWKIILITPDGAEHELRPTDFNGDAYPGSQDFLRGYYRVKPTGTSMRYYSVDGSFLFATISNLLDWTVYLPDGTRIIQTPDGIQRIQDTNGNKIKFFSDTEGGHIQDEQTGREIKITYDPSGNGGQGQSRVWYRTVTGIEHHIDLNWGTTTVQGKSYVLNDWSPSGGETGGGIVCQRHEILAETQITILRELVFPQTEPGQAQRKFEFTYNSDATEENISEGGSQAGCNGPIYGNPRTASFGWGELSQMELPAGAVVDYSFDLDGAHSLQPFPVTDYLTYQYITEKKVTHDGTFDIWTYSIGETYGTVSNPDGTGVFESRYCSTPQTPGCSEDKAGLVYRSSRASVMTEKHWTNLVFSNAHTSSPGGILAFNPVVDAEYTSLMEGNPAQAVKMSAKTFQYDYNGNLTQTIEYDWFDPTGIPRDAQGVPTGVPGSATVLRVTNHSHYNQAAGWTSDNVYAKRSVSTGAPLILNAPEQTTVGPSETTVAGIVRLTYDGQPYGSPPTFGNLTTKSVWFDLESRWITTSSTYGPYGNLATTTDAHGKVTTFGYLNPALGLPTSVTVDPQNGTGAQITTTEYDNSTGLVTATIDANGKRSEINYTNQLLGAIDPFGRPGVVIGPDLGGGVNHRTRTFYEDNARTVTVLSDLNSEGDGLLKSQTISDMLGRAIESRQYETANDFIAVRKSYDPPTRTQKTSNPFRANEAVVWTTSTTDLLGRVISVTTPDNAAVTTSYSANFTTVTDQAGKKRRSMTDALGRLSRVDEPDKDSGQLGSTAEPIQPTCYRYDVLGNLTKVIQGSQIDPVTGTCALSGSQQRTFTYDSLSRLRTAVNPESGTISYNYDDNGNLTQKIDPRLLSDNQTHVTTTYAYDSLNRVISRSYNDGSPSGYTDRTPAVTYTYDTLTNGKGRLTSVSSSVSTYSYGGYDAMGRVTSASQTIGAQTYPITNINYDLAGHLKTMTYPSGRTITNTFDGAGRLSSFAGNLGDGGAPRTYANGFSYSSFGGLQEEKFGTQTPIYHKLRYNSRGQLWDMRASTVSFATDPANGDRGAIVNYYSNTFTQGGSGSDNNGNLLRQENYIPGSSFFQDTFTYDSLNRLTSIAEKLNGTGTDSFKQVYVYDRWGNRTIDQVNTTPQVPKPNFGVNPNNNRLTVPAGYTMSYDNAGNLINDTYTGQGTRTYDAENRMKQAWANGQWQTYSYDGDGRRVKRNANGTETWHVHGIGGELIAEYAANGAPANPQKEYGYRNGELLVTTETSSGGGGGSAQPVTWTNTVGVTANGNNLTKTAAEGWGNAGASSTQSIASGDGYVETTISETNKYRMIGLSNGDSHQNFNDIDFAFYPAIGATLYIYEGGTSRGTFGAYATGDVLRVAVEGGVVKYRKNGTLLYTSMVTPTYPLLVDTSFYSNGATASNVMISTGSSGGGSTQNASWTNTVGVSASGNNLTKTAAGGWGNAGAASTQTIASGDGYVEFTASETNTYRMIGLSNGDSHQNFDDIDFALYPAIGGTLYVYEGGVSRGTFGTYATGDLLRVAIEGGVVKYRKNGTLLYTSTVAPTYPLLVDTAFYSNGATLNNVVISGAAGGGGGSSATVRWLVADQLGTPRMIFDQSGSLANVSRHDYLPFGEELYSGTGGRTTGQGYPSGPNAIDGVRQKFTSKERDVETGLDYLSARYYSSSQGRFSSVDPKFLSEKKLVNPQRWNHYTYVVNNPLTLYDPDGREDQGKGGGRVIDVFLSHDKSLKGIDQMTKDQRARLDKVIAQAQRKGIEINVRNDFNATAENAATAVSRANSIVVLGLHSGQDDRTKQYLGSFTETGVLSRGGIVNTDANGQYVRTATGSPQAALVVALSCESDDFAGAAFNGTANVVAVNGQPSTYGLNNAVIATLDTLVRSNANINPGTVQAVQAAAQRAIRNNPQQGNPDPNVTVVINPQVAPPTELERNILTKRPED